MNLKFLVLVTLLATSAAYADAGWSGDASLGFLNTSGNTETRSLNSKATASCATRAWTHTVRFAALNAQQQESATDERYSAGYRATWEMTAFDYVFGSLDYDNDRFSGVIQRTTEGIGYGRHFLRGPIHTLDAELGAGATQQKLASEGRTSALVGLFNARYQWRISDTSTFSQRVKVETSKDNTFINPVTELKLVIAGSLFTILGYELRTNTEVPTGTRKTDTLTSVNLGYSFGKKPT